MERQNNWDKFEVALLVEAYLKVVKKQEVLPVVLQQLSEDLRHKAVLAGMEIDETYRNLNGMHWQYGFIKLAFERKEFPTRKPPKLFLEIVKMYKEDEKAFDALLDEAHRLIGRNVDKQMELSTKEQFKIWLSSKVSQNIWVDLYIECLERVSLYACKHRMSNEAFWDIKDVKHFNMARTTILGSKLYRFTHPKDYRMFEKAGKYFSDFLKELAVKENVSDKKIVSQDEEKNDETVVAQSIEVERKYVVHPKFGYGIVVDEALIAHTVKFCDFNIGEKQIAKSFLGLKEVSKAEYELNLEQKFTETLQEGETVEAVDVEEVPLDEKYRGFIHFLGDEEAVKCFLKLYDYQKEKVADSILDVREGLIGVKRNNEKLRFYVTAERQIRFPKVLRAREVFVEDFLAVNIEEYFKAIDETNEYFLNNYSDVTLGVKTEPKGGYEQIPTIRAKYQPVPLANDTLAEELAKLILKKFPYGIRVDSPIDILKLRQAANLFGIFLPEEDEKIIAQLLRIGISVDGKTYLFADEVVEELIQNILQVFDNGNSVIYLEKYLELHYEWLDERHIQSTNLLKELLERNLKNVHLTKNFLVQGRRITELDAVVKALKEKWGEEVIHSYDDLYGLLPYIPEEKIRQYMSMSQDFVWVSNETYANLDKFIITDEQKNRIIDYVTQQCETDGFASLADIPMEDVEEENYELSITAIYSAIYNRVLSNNFVLEGKILTKKGQTSVDAVLLVKKYCSAKDECSFEELADYVIELTGSTHRQIAFEAAYGAMVRKNKEYFIADKFVEFDCDRIDALLDEYIDGDFTAIRNITAFTMFPMCGQEWNHYLLESYCHKYSKKYTLRVINYNDKNAGIIARNDLNISYKEMLAQVLAKAGVDLVPTVAGRCLCDNGYLAKSKYAGLAEIVEMAKDLKEE